jgi:hypothetical protein
MEDPLKERFVPAGGAGGSSPSEACQSRAIDWGYPGLSFLRQRSHTRLLPMATECLSHTGREQIAQVG